MSVPKGHVFVPISERFWKRVEIGPPNKCWRWLGRMRGGIRMARPYGVIWSNSKHRPASQIAWEIDNGKPFPEGMMACHTCDNTCVNPFHIWPGTMSDNIKDAVAKGRHKSVGRSALTHCKHGHEFTPENTIVRPGTIHRVCRTCRDRRNRSRYAA